MFLGSWYFQQERKRMRIDKKSLSYHPIQLEERQLNQSNSYTTLTKQHKTLSSNSTHFYSPPKFQLLFQFHTLQFQTPHRFFILFPNWVLKKIWFCLYFISPNEFQKLGRFLGFLCESTFETSYEALALCGNAFEYFVLGGFGFLQLVVFVVCSFIWVWVCLV